MVVFQYDEEKAIETILYLARRISDADVYGVCKLLYFTDKTSLEKYGRFIFGEQYVAMEQGATPSRAYNVLKLARAREINGLHVNGNKIETLRDADVSSLSKSDIECLDKIIDAYGNKPGWYRWKDAHDDAWEKSWNARGSSKNPAIDVIDIAKSLGDSEDLVDFLTKGDPD